MTWQRLLRGFDRGSETVSMMTRHQGENHGYNSSMRHCHFVVERYNQGLLAA